MNTLAKLSITLAAGIVIGIGAVRPFSEPTSDAEETGNAATPLYWVAPMDPDYRRDQPGKSPMGMDLVPVYSDNEPHNDPGSIRISPDVVNNLGVRSMVVGRGHLDLTVNTVGYVQYDEDRLIHIHPRVEGWVEKLYVKAAGDPVEKDAPLYALYSPTLVNAQEELLLARKRNNPALITAATARLHALQVPASDIQTLLRTGEVSQTITVRAPQSGVVDRLDTREGMYVKPGMEMMSIGQLEHIWVIGEVFERQAMSVTEGAPVSMYLDYLPGRQWSGTVDYIYPSLNAQTRTARIRVHLDNPDGYLRPGMFAQMAITIPHRQPAILAPREALIRTGNQTRVVLDQGNGRFKSVAVTVGRVADEQAEILTGLYSGDRIVTSAQFLIDSESSKSSDFKRMAHSTSDDNSASTDGIIKKIDFERRVLTISRGPIEKWQRPAVTMDFTVSPALDLSGLRENAAIHFTFVIHGGEFIVTALHLQDSTMTMSDEARSHD